MDFSVPVFVHMLDAGNFFLGTELFYSKRPPPQNMATQNRTLRGQTEAENTIIANSSTREGWLLVGRGPAKVDNGHLGTSSTRANNGPDCGMSGVSHVSAGRCRRKENGSPRHCPNGPWSTEMMVENGDGQASMQTGTL